MSAYSFILGRTLTLAWGRNSGFGPKFVGE